jgi:hypothetical protein
MMGLGAALAATACRVPDDPLLAMAGPRDLVRFELRDGDNQSIWIIQSSEARTLRALYYGEVPAGFRQLHPPAGQHPRPLVAGEPLRTETRTRRRLFIHAGYAVGRASFRARQSWMERLERADPD